MAHAKTREIEFDKLDVGLGWDEFMRSLIRALAGTLEDVVGIDDASGFISVVGQTLGHEINRDYRTAAGLDKLEREQVADVLVDLKTRIRGEFSITEQDDDKLVLSNCACPFAKQVNGRPSICMMTSNVFGSIAAENLGYAKVELQKTIARGDPGCRVVVHLRQTPEARACDGHEYFQSKPQKRS